MFFLVFPYSDMFSALSCISVTEVESTSICYFFHFSLFSPHVYLFIHFPFQCLQRKS